MKRAELEALMETYEYLFFDTALVFHAYRAYLRDYELILYSSGTGEYKGLYSCVLRYCVEATTKTQLIAETWRASLDDRLTNFQMYKSLWDQGIELDGFVWGVRFSENYQGWRLVKDSERASYWTEELGFEFHEVLIETNPFEIRLIFSDLIVTKLLDEAPDDEEYQEWLERYWSASAPSPPFYTASELARTPPSQIGLSVDTFRADIVESSQARMLSTTSFTVLLNEKPVGMIQPVGADRSTSVIVGRFKPLPAYEQVQSLFRQITEVTSAALPDVDQEVMAPLLRARDALDLSVITAGGRPVPMQELLVYDVAGIDAEPNGYGAEFAVTLEGFFDDPRYWSG
jgi:hypothetical protein